MYKSRKQKRDTGKNRLLLSVLLCFVEPKKTYKIIITLLIVFNRFIKQILIKTDSFFLKNSCFFKRFYQKRITTVTIKNIIRRLLPRKTIARLKLVNI